MKKHKQRQAVTNRARNTRIRHQENSDWDSVLHLQPLETAVSWRLLNTAHSVPTSSVKQLIK